MTERTGYLAYSAADMKGTITHCLKMILDQPISALHNAAISLTCFEAFSGLSRII